MRLTEIPITEVFRFKPNLVFDMPVDHLSTPATPVSTTLPEITIPDSDGIPWGKVALVGGLLIVGVLIIRSLTKASRVKESR